LNSSHHDVVTIGASAGGVEVLLTLAQSLPKDLPAAIFVVIHTVPMQVSTLPELLSSRGPLPAAHPLHEERIEPGHIYVAPPDNQLMLSRGAMQVIRGPRENGHRPAVDALFRSAASEFGARVIGVVLSGFQDCGTAGIMSIKARGGLSIVQDPRTAVAAQMPQSVIDQGLADHVAAPVELGALIEKLVAMEAGAGSDPDVGTRQLEGMAPAARADLVCPLCAGVLANVQRGTFEHFRCHVGHTFSLESLVAEQGEAMEKTLWGAVRALEEGATLSRRLAGAEKGELSRRFAEKARTQAQQAEVIRSMLLYGSRLSAVDASQLKQGP
jgi:two-component system chemotaxis response regulator CheB